MNLRAENVSKKYFRQTGTANYFEAVSSLSISLESGQLTVLTGRSGSGKTTLMHMLAGLLVPDTGKVFLGSSDLYAMTDPELARERNDHIAVIPQSRSGIESLTVWENILLPRLLYSASSREEAAAEWMERLEIQSLRNAYPKELSGGELRRMAIARAMTWNAEVILADEPTGDLDTESTGKVLSILRDAAHRDGKTVLLVTHECEAAAFADRIFRMDGGKLAEIDYKYTTCTF